MIVVLVVLVAACAPAPAAQSNATAVLTEEVALVQTSAPPTPEVTPMVTAEPTPAGPVTLEIWWPEPLAPLDNESAAEVVSQQLSGFQQANSDIVVDYRLKRVEDVGGIMATLRTASAVAPGALPDLVLMRRSDLLVAVENGLVQPFDERNLSAFLEGVQPVGLALGTVDGRLYGLPYMLDVRHVAYVPPEPVIDDWSFEAMLSREIPFVFPAGPTTGVSDVVLAEYLAAGGAVSQSGAPLVDAEALQTVLAFYETALEQGVVESNVLEYAVPANYAEALTSDEPLSAVVDSTLYLTLADAGVDMGVAPLPTADGEPVTVVDGWMWVMTTSDPEGQARAERLLNWMLDAERQSEYALVVHMLPSQRSALRALEDNTYIEFVSLLLENAVLPLVESENGALARAMQSALAAVLSGQRTAAGATQDVLTTLDG